MQNDSVEISYQPRARISKKSNTDVEAVISFLLGDPVKMTKAQAELCNRIIFVDGLISARKLSTAEIVNQVVEHFNVSLYRAQQDIYDCQKVFAETRKTKKEYLLAHHIDNIRIQIAKAEEAGDYKSLPKLYDSYTYALNSIPADVEIKDVAPATIVYNFNGQLPISTMPLDEVIQKAQKLLNPAKHGEFISFEEDSQPEPSTNDAAAGASQHDAAAMGQGNG